MFLTDHAKHCPWPGLESFRCDRTAAYAADPESSMFQPPQGPLQFNDSLDRVIVNLNLGFEISLVFRGVDSIPQGIFANLRTSQYLLFDVCSRSFQICNFPFHTGP
jgi:hypothetical protein